jgi:uncharacterized membrane protein YccC
LAVVDRKSRNKRAAEKYRKKKRGELEQQAMDLQAAVQANAVLRQRLALQDRLLHQYRSQLAAHGGELTAITRAIEAELAVAATAPFADTEAASALGALSAGSPHSSSISEEDYSNPDSNS